MSNDKNKKGIKLDDSTLEDVNSSLYNFDFNDENDEKDFYEYNENDLNDFKPIGSIDNEYLNSLKKNDESEKKYNPFNKFKSKSYEDQINEEINKNNDFEINNDSLSNNLTKNKDTLIKNKNHRQKQELEEEIVSIMKSNDNESTKNSQLNNHDEITIFEQDEKQKINKDIVELSDEQLKSLMESAFYVYGGEGLALSDLKRLTLCPISSIKRVLDKWIKELENDDSRGITIKMFGEKYKFFTKEKNREDLSRLITVKYKNPLSQKIMETLAIIAYNQPCTKSIIEDIRGKDPTQAIMKLIDLGLVNEAGRSSGPGRPLLFTVTPKFYDIFGIKNLSDLPTINLDQPFQDDDISFFDTTRFND